ncbi:EAL domain-containing protein [Alicyclobacillus cycloheptanicus]|uniref:Diguanylate cyclase (GGDEF)-like protein/PAS domain S-box-containing protein n=1 Tax=Alicyclobacillus cycloheptanicus TaxID=1457 RepID=A0ABT9XHY1_9BACL|nr:EAL domain-containing protein [Alicyclobacillus cycloheptanicus]MDQ0189923.1 diguanylate cyclase (GGDEF)-like protein/PAS domain S-box-containing protein [Alicyclobacillus cycloheptanicus]WDM02174.1 EAL domain-containing protein [Alicyclobacillus cycloheptanicus]
MDEQVVSRGVWRATLAIAIAVISVSVISERFSAYVQRVWAIHAQLDIVFDSLICALAVVPLTYYSVARIARSFREANNKFITLVRQNITGIFIYQEGKFQYVNPRFAEMFGYEVSDLVTGGISFSDIVDEKCIPLINETICREVTNTRDPDRHYELACKTAQGESLACEVYLTRSLYRGKPAIIGTIIDRTERKQIELALSRREQQYRALFQHNPSPVYSLDTAGCFTDVNPAGPDIIGYPVDELIGKPFMPYLLSDDLPEALSAFRTALEGEACHVNLSVIHKTGAHRNLELNIIPIVVNGQVEGVHGIARDVTKEKKADAFLEGQRRVLEMIAKSEKLNHVLKELIDIAENQFEGCIACVYLIDKQTNHLVFALGPSLPAACLEKVRDIAIDAHNGSSANAVIRKEPVIVTNIFADPRWSNLRTVAREHDLHACWSIPILNAFGEVLGTFTLSFGSEQSPDLKELDLMKTITYLAGLAIERKQNEEYVEHLAFYDPLTDLPNRRLFTERLSQAVDHAKRSLQRLAVMYVDVDRFKQINDSLGHNYGDLFLIEIAQRLTQCVRDTDTVARMSGDEFTILLYPMNVIGDAIEVAQRIMRAFAEPVMLEGNEFNITASIGIAVFPDDADHVSSLIRNADVAMYAAKSLGKNTYQVYTPAMNDKAFDTLILQSAMSKALAKGEFVLHYQPRVNVHTSKIVGAEALIRWNHPVRGVLAPGEFIHLAEETGFIVPLGKWVIREACKQNKAWQDAGHPPIRVAVNVSAQQFFQNSIVCDIAEALESTGLSPRDLEIEITEGTLMKHERTIVGILEELHAMGVHISVDDFGTGYSSLSYLKQFKVHTLKIDQSFIKGIPDKPDDTAIAETVIALARALKLSVIAEGVETQAQLEFLRSKQCDELQGYLLGRPVPPEKFSFEIEMAHAP